MTLPEDETAKMVRAYRDGEPYVLDVLEVECGHVMAKDLALQARAAIRAGREDGLTISISSAFRTMEKQQQLYRLWKEGVPGYNPADAPGHSLHQQGVALDLHFGSAEERERFAALAVAHGFSRPVAREPWHFVVSPLTEGVS